MKTTLAVLVLSTLCAAQGKVNVTVIDRHDSNIAYSYAFINGDTGIAQNLNLSDATLTLQLPNGDSAVVNCTSKFQERFAGPGNMRSCRVPLVDDFVADFSEDKAKLIWPTREGTSPCSRQSKIWLIEDSGCSSKSALTLPPTAKARASAISWRVPTNEPRIVMQFATTSKSGTGNSPGGSPTKTQVPRFRVMPTPCLNAINEGAVIRTP